MFGKPYTVITDYAPLKWIMTTTKFTGKLARWALLLQEYESEVIHRPGVANSNADGCSRCPLPETATHNHETETLGEKTPCYYMQTSPMGHILPSYFLSFHQGAPLREDVKVDIWDDNATMTLLETHAYLPYLTPQQRDRTYRRALKYRWMG